MAEVKVKNVLTKISKGHLECPICCGRFNDPKILDCLHSFCLNCLDEFVRGQDPEKEKITCPVCRRETTIPANGLKDLSNCFFLSSLVDEVQELERALDDTPRPTLTCEECEEGLEAVARCFDCKENICQECQKAHMDSQSSINHRILSLDDLIKIGASFNEPRQSTVPKCQKHPDREVTFYWDTCKSLTCAKCAATDHRTVEHNYFEITDFASSFRADIHAAFKRFEKSRERFKEVDDSIEHTRNRLKTMVTMACRDVSDKEEEEIAKIRNKARILKERVTQIGRERDCEYEEVHVSNRDKIDRAEQVMAAVKDLVQQADDFQLLGLKPKLVHNLQLSEELMFEPVRHESSFIRVRCHDVVGEMDLGDLLYEKAWQLNAQFGKKGTANGKFKFATCAACFSDGDIVVTDIINKRASVFTSGGRYKTTVGRSWTETKLEDPWGVAVTWDDQLVVSDRDTVKAFDANRRVTHQFPTSPGSKLRGIAVDKMKRIAVTDVGRKVITLHNPDGSLITTIAHDMVDNYVAIGDKERLMFTNYGGRRLLCVDFRGNVLFNIIISVGGEPARPTGVCCDDAGDIYLAVHSDDYKRNRVLRYTAEGEFVGIVADGLVYPVDTTFNPRGDLVVTDNVSVKIFQRV